MSAGVSLGKHLRALRLEAGLSQRAVAAGMGCCWSFVSGVECGKYGDPRLSTILRYCDAIGARIMIRLEEET